MTSAKKKPTQSTTQPTNGNWADAMKAALTQKRPAGGFPTQPKPRDSGVQKVKKNSF